MNQSQLSLERQIGQMIMPAIPGAGVRPGGSILEQAARLIRDCHVGGFALFRGSVHETPRLVASLQEMSGAPLFIACDLEAGPGSQLQGGVVFPSGMAIGYRGDVQIAAEAGRLTALAARKAGINLVFAPVVDVNSNPRNPIICTRSYSDRPDRAADFAAAFIGGCQGAGCIATAKHFPGHGDTETDSHSDLPVIRKSPEDIREVEMPPFRAAIRAGVRAVMTGHLAVPALDATGLPATLSGKMVAGVLRGELGFRGVVVTDALMMDAVKDRWPQEEILEMAVNAGCDVLLMPEDPFLAHAQMLEMVKAGKIDRRRIEESCARILETKRFLDGAGPEIPEDLDGQCAVFAREAARKGVAVKCAVELPLRDPCAALIATPERVLDFNPFVAALKCAAPALPIRRISPAPAEAEIRRVVEGINEADTVILAFYPRPAAWGEGVQADAALQKLAAEIARKKELVLISFGSPYAAREMAAVRNFIEPFGDCPASQEAAAEILLGKARFTPEAARGI